MRQYAATFGTKYNHEQHPASPAITGESFIVVDAETEAEARQKVFDLVGPNWAFLYDVGPEFIKMAGRYGLTNETWSL